MTRDDRDTRARTRAITLIALATNLALVVIPSEVCFGDR